jgi:MscS family membrane protein
MVRPVHPLESPPSLRQGLRRARRVALAALLGVLSVPGARASAQLRLGGTRPPVDTGRAVPSPGSPRAAVETFLRLAEARDWEGASAYLALNEAQRARGAELARALKAVIDQRLVLDPMALSPLAAGDTTDGDPLGDRVGVVRGPDGHEEPVRLVRQPRDPEVAWVFSSATVGRIDGWYAELGASWLRDRLPRALRGEGWAHLYWWQWLGVLAAIPVLLLVGWLASTGGRLLLTRLARRTATEWDDLILEHIPGPFRLAVAALAAGPLLGVLALNARAAAFVGDARRGALLLALFWGLLRVITVAQQRLVSAAWLGGQEAEARTLVPLLGNILRVVVATGALLAALAQFGYPVGTLLAGLGIGGIAVALAAQKTVEHLFGSVSLAADRAFRVGDWVRAGTTEGTVERIGLRSTSLRTFERTVVRIPNGRLADERIETFGERDRILLRTDLDLTYGTPPATIDRIREVLLARLRAHPLIWEESVRVHVIAFTESAVRMRVMAWFRTTTWEDFLLIRHQLLLEFLQVVAAEGSSFAYPSRTVYHVQPEGMGAGPATGGAPSAPPGAPPVDGGD